MYRTARGPKGKDNFLEAIVRGRLAGVELGLKKLEHEDDVTRRALDLVKGAKFSFDVPAPQPIVYGGWRIVTTLGP